MEQKTWYVYLLCDPDTEIPFYVGKGTGKRMLMHEYNGYDPNIEKKRIIRQIQAQGKQVLRKKIAEFADEQDAFIYEWAMINLYHECLTNMKPGGNKIRSMPAPPEKVQEYLTLDEASGYIGMKRATLYLYIKDLGIETYKFGRHKYAYIAIKDVKRIKEVQAKPWLMER